MAVFTLTCLSLKACHKQCNPSMCASDKTVKSCSTLSQVTLIILRRFPENKFQRTVTCKNNVLKTKNFNLLSPWFQFFLKNGAEANPPPPPNVIDKKSCTILHHSCLLGLKCCKHTNLGYTGKPLPD